LLLVDVFENNANGWGVTETTPATIEVEAGRLTFTVTDPAAASGRTAFANPKVALPADVDLTFDVQLLEGETAWYGATCRHGDLGMYVFLLGNQGTFAIAGFSRLQDSWQVLAIGNASPHLNLNDTPNTLNIVCAGDRLKLGLNGETLAAVQDSTYTSGSVFLAAESLAGGTISVGYTNFVAASPRPADYSRSVSAFTDTVAFETNKTGEWSIFQFTDPGIWSLATQQEGNAGFPAWAPDGNRLAYVSDPSGNMEIYVLDASTGEVVQLTDGPADDLAPAWSPDGRTIAFISDRGGAHQIYTVPASGGEAAPITSGDKVDYQNPSWSPDGTRITYTSFRTGACEVYVILLDSHAEAQLTHNPPSAVHDGCRAAWSPDSRQIAYVSARDGNLEIYLLDVETGSELRLTHHPGIDSFPAWTSDGTRLVFVSDRAEQDVSTDLYLMNADGSGYMRLTDAHAIVTWPAVSP
jgi:Tol biopolymer transport system component